MARIPTEFRAHSRALTDHYQTRWLTAHPDGRVVTRDLARDPIPHLDQTTIDALYAAKSSDAPASPASALSDTLIAELISAHAIVIGALFTPTSIASTEPEWIGAFTADDRRAITELRAGQAAAVSSGDVESYAKLCADDVYWMFPGRDIVTGRTRFLEAQRSLRNGAAKILSMRKTPLRPNAPRFSSTKSSTTPSTKSPPSSAKAAPPAANSPLAPALHSKPKSPASPPHPTNTNASSAPFSRPPATAISTASNRSSPTPSNSTPTAAARSRPSPKSCMAPTP